MLATNYGDSAGCKTTVKLPRANLSQASPGISSGTPGSLGSSSMGMSASASLSPEVRGMQRGLHILQDIGVLELLENDDRPTFLIDLSNPQNANHPGLPVVYSNATLRTAQGLQHLLTPEQDDAAKPASVSPEFELFKSWVMTPPDPTETSEPPAQSFQYGGIPWVSTTLRRRFRFVSGSGVYRPRSPSPQSRGDDVAAAEGDGEAAAGFPSPGLAADPAEGADPADYFGDAGLEVLDGGNVDDGLAVDIDFDNDRCHPDDFTNQVLQSLPDKDTFDWTRIPYSDDLPDFIKMLKMTDWASTRLGPIEDWDPHLRALSNLVLATPHPAALWWGPNHLGFYNSGFAELAGEQHSRTLGSSYEDVWNEVWHLTGPLFRLAWETGQATMQQEHQLFIKRNGFLEEVFFSYSIIPVLGDEGEVVAIYCPCFENTRRRISERRMLTLREVGEHVVTATAVSNFWPQVQRGLEYNEFDIPFSIIYAVRDETESEVSSLHSGSRFHSLSLVLEGAGGVPEGHLAAPPFLDLHTSDEGFAPQMRQSLAKGGVPILLDLDDGTLPPNLIEGFSWRGFGDPYRKVVVFPVVPTNTGEAVAGFIVLGVNPRRPYDDDYKLFIHLLSRQLATSMASVVLFEEEIRRGRHAAKLAALDRQELSEQLWRRTQEANELEYKFTRMAEFAPVGIFMADGTGHINYCNDMWWQISRHSRSDEIGEGWMNSVREEDRARLDEAWNKLLQGEGTISVEFRFNCSQQYGTTTIDTWVLMSAFPEKNFDGSVMSIFGCITDISSQKWAELVQSERRQEAVELKRQQENFVDMTSHEMRNPLSAVLQCVDQIVNAITTFTEHDDRREVDMLLDDCLDAANTIGLCASHQKRIVDDILTLSKLDSSLVSVTPVDEQPIRVISRTLKMFEAELMAHDIELEVLVDDSFDRLDLKWAKFDPSRIRQVLINLMTNAIKFTQGRKKRMIVVSLSATKHISDITSTGVSYLDRHEHQRGKPINLEDEEWGTGERLNIHCSVQDSGPGLGPQELKLLFQRFQQVRPRTHVQYGGSGLGLFISRILTEMHGGQIGVSSEEDFGSRFSFYIQCRKSLHPPMEPERLPPVKTRHKMQPSMSTRIKPAEPVAPLQHAGNPMPLSPAAPFDSPTGFDVLIVEDNIVNQKVLSRQLRSCGNNIFVANHGREALQTLQRSKFWLGQEAHGIDVSVILMDLEMPIMDGITCARKIRELEREGIITSHIPIIAVTAYARPEQIASAKAAGIDDVISKPFRLPELLPKIEELVAKFRPDLSTRRVSEPNDALFARSI
ncbi:Histidine protein kinase NIK1 [Escovopsis weberi]|uniref:Histidine protein kinase NIK1 n=1 Tax=Escovopsis weberi TaxID=150374 RepID=A0A0M9VTL3_ESCWE|nr:Histidine protein kinase NIK1 [Escovopsis weberi]